ncbi:uncharacterized protein LY79DRAFT_267752 [Colletotrichum navitas]|uniref:Uncharacterized protein n=1 Tax=Colletotrichum navitas TaxID=681940 RepID=A0AAD8PVD4_9PEZI|nr:uncharacterized protein LY79DRAFT_267752 [Colletotrichum navitas]KAK1585409.1 hypothetical protein LY79DRAFT_267752 [Colletotrichum navitas]
MCVGVGVYSLHVCPKCSVPSGSNIMRFMKLCLIVASDMGSNLKAGFCQDPEHFPGSQPRASRPSRCCASGHGHDHIPNLLGYPVCVIKGKISLLPSCDLFASFFAQIVLCKCQRIASLRRGVFSRPFGSHIPKDRMRLWPSPDHTALTVNPRGR